MASDSDVTSVRIARIILRLVHDPRGISSRQIMDEFGLAERTERKYRTLLLDNFRDEFQRMGFDLVQEGSTLDDRRLILRAHGEEPDDSSRLSLLVSLAMSQALFNAMGQVDHARAMKDSVEAYSRKDLRSVWRFNDLDRKLHVVPDAPQDYTRREADITAVLRAIFTHREITFDYCGVNDADYTRRRVRPLSLVSWRGGLYLAGQRDDRRFRLYAISRMRNAQAVLKSEFIYPGRESYDPRLLFDARFGLYEEESAVPRRVELVFANSQWLKRYLTERRWHASQTFTELPDGRLRMTMKLRTLAEVRLWVRQFGDDVEVIRPEDLLTTAAEDPAVDDRDAT